MFKVGDNVVCIDDSSARVDIDEEYTITWVNSSSKTVKVAEFPSNVFGSHRFELVEERKEEKKMFKVGDKIICINGFNSRVSTGREYTVTWSDGNSNKLMVAEFPSSLFGSYRFELLEETKEPQEDNLWDMLEEALPKLSRNELKTIVFSNIYEGNILEMAKKYKMSLSDLSILVNTFNKFTGADK